MALYHVSSVSATLNNLNDGIRTQCEKKTVIANGWCEVEHHLDVCRATSGAHVEFVECKTFLESF